MDVLTEPMETVGLVSPGKAGQIALPFLNWAREVKASRSSH
jgi:hypothetical protein